MSILLIHVLLATMHVLYVVRNRHTSDSWSTVGELLALSQNWQPASTVLQAAEHRGLDRPLEDIAQIAKVRVRQTPGSMADHGYEHAHAHQHVELVSDESPQALDRDTQGAHRRSAWLREKMHLRHPATWLDRRFGVLMSASAERLVPQISSESQTMMGIVRLDRLYG